MEGSSERPQAIREPEATDTKQERLSTLPNQRKKLLAEIRQVGVVSSTRLSNGQTASEFAHEYVLSQLKFK